MIQLTSIEALTNAVTKARTVKPHVRFVVFRHYVVTNKQTGVTYTVTFDKQGAHRLASCDCKAGARNRACYHVAKLMRKRSKSGCCARNRACYHVAAAVGHHILQAAEIAELGL